MTEKLDPPAARDAGQPGPRNADLPAARDAGQPAPQNGDLSAARDASQPGPRNANLPAAQAAGRATGRATARPVRDGVGLGLAVGTSGLAFGAAAVGSGLSVAQACVLSLLAFTGASQFALAGAIAGGGSLAGGVASAVLLGSRNALYGLRLTHVLEPRGPRKLLLAQGVIDETTAVSLAQPDAASARLAFRVTFATIYVTWNLCTLLGAYGAGRLGSPQSLGLDVVGPAAFLALIWPQLRAGRTERAVGLLGAAVALTATPFLPPGVPVILAATAALAGALAAPAGAAPPRAAPARARETP